MARLTISAVFPSQERQETHKETVLDGMVSQKLLSVFFRCTPEELDSVAHRDGINQQFIPKGESKKLHAFYNVDAIPLLLKGLQKNPQAPEWLDAVDTSQPQFEITLPTGSVIKYEAL